MDINSEPVNNSPALSYKTEQERAICFSKAAELQENMRPQGGNLEATISNPERVLNINQSECPPHDAASQTDNNNIINI